MSNGMRSFTLHRTQGPEAAALQPNVPVAARDAAGHPELSNLDAETVARQYLQTALASPSLPSFTASEVNGQACEFKSLGVETILFTNTQTVKFRQYYRKIPVYGSLVTVELDEANSLVSISSALGEPTNVDPVASLAPAQALAKALELAGYRPTQHLDATPRLYYYFDQSTQRWRLVYIIENVLKQRPEPDGDEALTALPEIVDYVLDAHSGALVRELPRTQTVDVQTTETADDGLGNSREFSTVRSDDGSRRLQDMSRNIHTHDCAFQFVQFIPLPGAYVRNPPSPWDPGGVSAHANSASVVEFLRTVLSRDGLDNSGGPIVSSVNCLFFGESTGQEWRNAARIPGQMIYGQRFVGGELVSYAVAEDVVAHELLHGLTDETAGLVYEFESGALNESYSDIFGIIVSNFNEPDISAWNWEMGEELSGLPLRDVSNPPRFNDPDHMDDYRHLPENIDHGGVHTNSGIHNKAAHNILTATDTSGNHLFDAVIVARMFYLALTQHLSRTSGFLDSRRGVELGARTLLMNDPDMDHKLSVIGQAFDDVGIRESIGPLVG
jgi:Zn-dependent metalloprotease